MPQSLAAVYMHIVFSTKHRQPLIADDVAPRLHAYLGGIVRNHGGIAVEVGGMPDHVHMLVSLGRTTSVAELVGVVKANSTNWVHATFPRLTEFCWQAGYGAFSVSVSNLDAVIQYIRNQSEHHQSMSFQDELREMWRRHRIEWDERYVWD